MEIKIFNHVAKQLYHNLDEFLAEQNGKDTMIVMFGSSKIAGMIIYYLGRCGRPAGAIIDNSPAAQGKTVYGLPVYAPAEFAKKHQGPVCFLIASGYQEEMIQQLLGLGYEGEQIIKIIDLPALMNDYSYADRSGLVRMTDDQIRKCQLGILNHLKEICEKYHLRYFLEFGTLLGAVRHKGYIPWDDDIDVAVELKDLYRLAEILKDDPDYGLVSHLNCEGYYDEYALMVDRHTISDINHFPTQVSAGVSIDIFPLCGAPENPQELDAYAKEAKRLDQQKWNHLYDTKAVLAAQKEEWDFLMRYDFDRCSKAGFILGNYFLRQIVDKKCFAESVEMEFEGGLYRVPAGYDQYLTSVYGDYMTPPPEDKRKGHHFYNSYFE